MNNMQPFLYDSAFNVWRKNFNNNEYLSNGPLTACIQLTKRCNLKCLYCFEPDFIGTEIEINEISRIIKSLSEAGTQLVRLTGGEPFLYKKIFKVISLIKNYGMHVAIDTNATLLTPSIIKLVKKDIVFCGVSLDGNVYLHDRYRGEYLKVVNAMALLDEYGIPVIISTVLTEQSYHDIFHILDIANKINAVSIRIVPMLKRGRGFNVNLSNHSNDFFDSLSEKIYNYKIRNSISVKVIIINWNNTVAGSVIMIKPNGDMVGTPGDHDISEEIHIGNTLYDSIPEIWKKYKYSLNHINKCLERTVSII